ncbi:hypothetical protein GCM10009682_01360 [Luedemannella flava]|uniref:Uncharacterized protein n=1 Tax=Luedemannella flava TaxID=349316 RepID=A0ABN2LBM6_9ACTN
MGTGSWLRRRVAAACGSADRFAALGVAFGDWLRLGDQASRATVDRVEPYLAAYLGSARRNGYRWGAAVGVAAGFGLSLVLVGVVVGIEALT